MGIAPSIPAPAGMLGGMVAGIRVIGGSIGVQLAPEPGIGVQRGVVAENARSRLWVSIEKVP